MAYINIEYVFEQLKVFRFFPDTVYTTAKFI